MYNVLVYYPKFDRKTEENIRAFRRKYDPFMDFWKPHIPFIFSVPCSEVEEENSTEYVQAVLKNWKPFSNHIGGFSKSWDHWLFLLLKEGNEEERTKKIEDTCFSLFKPVFGSAEKL